MSPINEVYNNIRTFEGGVTNVGYDIDGRIIAARVTPNAYKDPNLNKWVYDYKLEEGYIDDAGDFVPVALTNMNNLRNAQLNQLINSGFMNSVINYTKNTAPGF